MSRQIKSLKQNKETFTGHLHREHRASRGRRYIQDYAKIQTFKQKVKELKERDLMLDLLDKEW